MGRKRKGQAASSRVVPALLRLFHRRGLDVDEFVRALGLAADAEHAAQASITPETFDALLAAGARALCDPLLALHLPQQLQWPTYHIGELAARASPTLREAFERVVRYAPLFYAHLAFRCQQRGDELVITQRLRSGATGLRYSNEYGLATTLFHARQLTGTPLAPRRVYFGHAGPAEQPAIAAHFGGAELGFDRDENGLAFGLDDVSRPCVGHDARLLRTAEDLAEQALAAAGPSSDFVGAVSVHIRESLPLAGVELALLARRMRMSARTLQRRLDEHGTSLTQLVESARKAAAFEALERSSLSLAEVARRAGFSDAAAFARAFRRWTGVSPGAYRNGRKG